MKSLSDKIYDLSPIFIQNLIISTYGKKIYRQRYNKSYHHWLKTFIDKDYSDLKQENSNQLFELVKLLTYAKENSPFYQHLYKNIDLSKISSLKDIASIPVLEKETLRANIDSFYTIKSTDGVESSTGGTTGKSLKVYFTMEDFQKRMAYLDAFKYKCGIKNLFGAKKATFSGRSFAKGFFQKKSKTYWRFNRAYNQRLYSTFDMQEANLPFYVDDLNDFKPEVINGFVSAIYQLSKYILDNNLVINFTPKAIFTTSETLLPVHREVIEQAFQCRLFNQYASAEGAPFITECIVGNLHYNLDTGVIEVTDSGEILVTSFTTYGTPLIRYNIGDRISLNENTESSICPCGNCHPIVDSIDGRAVDYLYSPDKGKVSLSHLADVIKGIPNSIKEIQFIQDNRNTIKVIVNVDREKYNLEDEKKIIDSMVYRFGNNMHFDIILVNEIKKTAGGKFSLIKNNLYADS